MGIEFMANKKYRIPRKKKKKIPKGIPYCYTPIDYNIKEGVYSIKYCPFHTRKKDLDEWCNLLQHEVDDSCKICNQRMPQPF
jgi:hypothetical protein